MWRAWLDCKVGVRKVNNLVVMLREKKWDAIDGEFLNTTSDFH